MVGINETVESGWRLARVQDVELNYDVVKNVVGREKKWTICKLQDGSLKGEGYGYVIDRLYKGGWGEKLLVVRVPGTSD